MSALVLRIKFPQTYPMIYKTLRVDPNLTVAEAVVYIAQTVSAPHTAQGGIGLFVPSQKKWLGENEPLSTYSSLQEEVGLPHSFFIHSSLHSSLSYYSSLNDSFFIL